MMSKCFANQAVLSGTNYVRWLANAKESDYNGETFADIRIMQGLTTSILTSDPTGDQGPTKGGPGVLGLVKSGQPTTVGAMPGMQRGK